MTTEKIIEGNKAIAEFMGAVFYNDTPMIMRQTINSPTTGNIITCADKLKYHSSWDWIMPVVEEIEALEVDAAPLPPSATPVPKRIYWFSIQQSNVVVGKDFSIESIFELYDYKKKGITKIQAVWQAVVQFIQWHTQLNKGVSPE